jgi:hypothetical protein
MHEFSQPTENGVLKRQTGYLVEHLVLFIRKVSYPDFRVGPRLKCKHQELRLFCTITTDHNDDNEPWGLGTVDK